MDSRVLNMEVVRAEEVSVLYVKAEVRAIMMKEQMVVQNAEEFRSEAWNDDKGESCSATKCCKTSGFQCFEKTPVSMDAWRSATPTRDGLA